MYKYIKDESNFYDLALELSESDTKVVFCDTETQGLDPRMSRILLFQIMVNDDIFIFDFLHLNTEHLKYLVNLLHTTKVTSVFHNTKFDLKFIYHNSGVWMDNVFDTMNCEVLINAGVGKSTYKLSELAIKYCGIELEKETRDLFSAGEVTVITDQMLDYSAMDVKVLKDIYRQQMELIRQAKEEAILKIEMDLLPAVAKMEYDGVLLDTDLWKELEANERQRLDRVTVDVLDCLIDEVDVTKYADATKLAEALAIPVKTKRLQNELVQFTTPEVMRNWARQNFNIASPKQLKTALNLIGIEVESTDKKVLAKLGSSKVIDALLEKSECSKRISTYGLGVLDFINPISGRIHTEFLNNGTATGRFSSGNPINLQNIPNAKGYRESFISSPEFKWISVDYNQQEFRLAGDISGEPKIIDAYNQGFDMHIAAGGVVYEKPLLDINKAERKVGKNTNFTLIYGGTEWALGRNLGLSVEDSKRIIESYKKGFPTFWAFKEAVESMVIKLGYSQTVLGRRRYATPKPLYQNSSEYLQYVNKNKRELFNMVVQGTAADITKIAMVNIYKNNPFGEKLRMLIQVHDEINSEAHNSVAKDASVFIKEEMEKAEQPFLKHIKAQADIAPISDYWVH